MKPVQVHAFFESASNTLSYAVWDAVSKDALVIDPVLDFDPATQITAKNSLEKIKQFVAQKALRVHWILDTHAHADHLTGSRNLKRDWPGVPWAMGETMAEVFENFRKVLAWPKDVQLQKLGVDRWLRDGEEFSAGTLRIQTLATPGHTPACLTYKIGDLLFTGDALMMPDSGTGRCDFPGGNAGKLYDSIWGKLYALPEGYKVFFGHDYQPGGRPLRYQTTIGEEKASNIHIRASTSRADFIKVREGRDKTLSAPRLLRPSLDWNLGADQLIKPLF